MNNVEKKNKIKNEEIVGENEAADVSGADNEEIVEVPGTENDGSGDVDFKESSPDLTKQVELYKDQLLRRAAEFENYKRRTENEISNITKLANEYLISDILPIIDDFERSLSSGKEKSETDPFYKGVEMIYSKLMKILEQKGLKPIEVLNKPFDVNFHEAMMTMPKDGVEPNTVIQELEKGYLLFDRVIRHSKVIVSAENNGG
jgi:molecular chaperone GrpE